MISERILARGFSSFWRNLLPMSDAFVKHINLDYERFDLEIDSLDNDSTTRALINENGFELFRLCLNTGRNLQDLEDHEIDEVYLKSKGKIRIYEGINNYLPDDLTKEDLKESMLIAKTLLSFYNPIKRNCIVSPYFQGCGIIDDCYGDLIDQKSKTLYEFKAGDRNFKSIDLRQVFVYLALNHSSNSYDIENFCLLNPRRGGLFKVDVDEACYIMSGREAHDIYSQIINFITLTDHSG